ncbi:MAG: ParB/RepB/Spo0J family partition protein [Oscillospiraceae bacterium]|nr:ParB/RepB/Spo0J family partition protein [Oscillospiraceae bacterium]
MAVQRGLGKGLDALFSDYSIENSAEIAMAEIEPDRHQPRKVFNEESLRELADSIAEHGVLQPILLRPIPDDGYRIVAGERRFRAAHLAGLTTIPAIVRDFSEQEAIEAALVENLQRENLNPIEEADGYQTLLNQSGLTQEEVAKRVGKSRSSVTNSLRLLTLTPHALELIRQGTLTAGHAKALLAIDRDKIDSIADRIVVEGLSVREVERLAQKKPKQHKINLPDTKDTIAREAELALRNALGVEVYVKYSAGKGNISINFYSQEQLLEFVNMLGEKNRG